MTGTHKPDRVGGLVLTLIVFSIYIEIASILNSFSLTSFPLVGFGTGARVQALLFGVLILNSSLFYISRQRRRAQTYQNPQK